MRKGGAYLGFVHSMENIPYFGVHNPTLYEGSGRPSRRDRFAVCQGETHQKIGNVTYAPHRRRHGAKSWSMTSRVLAHMSKQEKTLTQWEGAL